MIKIKSRRNLISVNAYDCFIEYTKSLLENKRLYGVNLKFSSFTNDPIIDKAFDEVFISKTGNKGGELLIWRSWLVEGVFPVMLYMKNDSSLSKLMQDESFYDAPSFSKKESNCSFFGRMSRPRENGYSFLSYLLERWKNTTHRAHPHFYFSVEDPEWVWHDLMKNKNQIKTGRSSVSCVMNIIFRWNSLKNIPIVTLIVKHNIWSHIWGDIFGGQAILLSLCKELGLPMKGEVNIFIISASMDEPSLAKKFLEKIIIE